MKQTVRLLCLSVVLAGLTSSAATSTPASLPVFVTPEDAFEQAKAQGHVQGIAISEDALYCGLFNVVVKFDLATGRLLKSVQAPRHTGDVCWSNGRLYTSVARGLFCGKRPKDFLGLVQVYDADLNLVKEKQLPMALDGITALDGVIFAGTCPANGERHRGCRIVRLREDTLDFIDEVAIDPGFEMKWAVQDMSTDGKLLYFSFYSCEKMARAVYTKDLQLVRTLPGSWSIGFDRLPARFQREGGPVRFGVFRKLERKDVNGLAVPGYAGWLQCNELDGTACVDVTPSETGRLREKPSAWLNLFNGKDLAGWTPKIRGFKAGENAGNTFRVIDGCLCNRYDDPLYADGFKERFGHLFYNGSFSNYVLRATYRMPLPQCKGGPGWAVYNNGVMLHGQTPETMSLDQSFPVSIECQLLSQISRGSARSTVNLCTPGTNVERDGKLYTPHTLNSTSPTFAPGKWTTIEAEVRGGERIIHRVGGETVLSYEHPQYDPTDNTAKPLIKAAGGDLIIRGGTISIQSESAPTDFKSILVKQL